MNYHYVSIEREYGSGGTQIGQELAERRSIPCYGIEILQQVSKNLGIDIAEIEQYEERATNSFLYSFYLLGQISDGSEPVSSEGRIYLEEQKVIRSLALEGPAVFIGRCAGNALTERKDVLKVFVQADRKWRRERAIEKYGVAANEAEVVVKKFDRKRSSYYMTNTGKNWTDLSNYHLILDSSRLGIERCAKIIEEAMSE